MAHVLTVIALAAASLLAIGVVGMMLLVINRAIDIVAGADQWMP